MEGVSFSVARGVRITDALHPPVRSLATGPPRSTASRRRRHDSLRFDPNHRVVWWGFFDLKREDIEVDFLTWWNSIGVPVQAAAISVVAGTISSIVAGVFLLRNARGREKHEENLDDTKTARDLLLTELKGQVDERLDMLKGDREQELADQARDFEGKLHLATQQHSNQLATAQNQQEQRLRHLESQLDQRKEIEKRLLSDYFSNREKVVARLGALRVAMAAVTPRLDALIARALDMPDRQMVRSAAILFQESSPILAESSPPLPAECEEAHERALSALTRVFLYLNDEQENRSVGGDPDKWVNEFVARVRVWRERVEAFSQVSRQEEGRDFARAERLIESSLEPQDR